jgi:hypothetical protein
MPQSHVTSVQNYENNEVKLQKKICLHFLTGKSTSDQQENPAKKKTVRSVKDLKGFVTSQKKPELER